MKETEGLASVDVSLPHIPRRQLATAAAAAAAAPRRLASRKSLFRRHMQHGVCGLRLWRCRLFPGGWLKPWKPLEGMVRA